MPNNLIEALGAWAATVPWFSTFTGGVWYDQLPDASSTVTPYLSFTQADSRTQNIVGFPGKAIVYPVVQVEVRADTEATARQLGEQARDAILSGGLLSWVNGRESGRFAIDGEGGGLEDGLGINGADVWAHRVPIQFITARG